jgi:hypothetical protein
MKQQALAVILLVMILAWACVASAITNTLPGPAEQGLHGSLDVSGKYKRMSRRVEASGALSAQWVHGSMSVFATGQGSTGRVAGVEYSRSQFHHLRGRKQISGPWYGEAFLQYSSNRFGPLRRRSIAGGALRLQLYGGGRVEISTGLGLFYELEKQMVGKSEVARVSSYMELQFRQKPLSLTAVAFFQPRAGRWQDRRALIESCAGIDILKWLTLKGDLALIYDTKPPDGKTRFEVVASESLAVRW